MERLTINELAPYLPYELKLYICDGGYEKPIEYPTLIGLHGDSIIQSRYRFKSIHCVDEVFSRPEMSNSLSIIKPLLRPLSSLTEVINHKGWHFNPLSKIYNEHNGFELDVNLNVETFTQSESGIGTYNILDNYMVMQKLFEWHFDVFGLIDRGLALPIDGKEVECE